MQLGASQLQRREGIFAELQGWHPLSRLLQHTQSCLCPTDANAAVSLGCNSSYIVHTIADCRLRFITCSASPRPETEEDHACTHACTHKD